MSTWPPQPTSPPSPLLFDRNLIDRGMICSFLTLATGNNQGHGLRMPC